MKKMVCLLVALVLALGSVGYGETVLAYESFESHTSGDLLVDWSLFGGYDGLTPDIGTDWALSWVQAQDAVVVGDVAYAGTKGSTQSRGGTGVPGLMTAIGTGVPINVNTPYVCSVMYQAADDATPADNTGGIFVSSGPSTGVAINASMSELGGEFKCWNGTGYVASGYIPNEGEWYLIEMELMVGAVPVAGNYPVTYDVFVTDEGGVKSQLADDYAGWGPLEATNLAFGWEMNLGCNRGAGSDGNSLVYFDEMKIVEVPEPATMSLIGLGVIGLLRRKRA